MNKKIVGLAFTAAALAAMSGSTFAADKVLTMSHWAGPKHAMASVMHPWLNEQLSSCSAGSLTVKLENGLAPPPAQYDTIRDGVADLGWIVHGYTKGKFLATKLIELPGIPGNAEEMSVAFQMAHEKYLAAAKEAKGVKVLANFVHGPGMINTAEKITSYKQVEGMKIRVGGGVANSVGEALGVAGVNMPAPSVYEAIASGVADGVFFPAESLSSFKIDELTKFSFKNPDGMYTTSFAYIMNEDSYDDLSDEHKACVDQISGVELARNIGRIWDEADAAGVAASAETGSVIIEASDEEREYFKAATADIEAAVLADVESRGIDANAALGFIREQLK
ncbi:MAG: TRAP transporter substrate-binding protein [Granulosicoccus sp.]